MGGSGQQGWSPFLWCPSHGWRPIVFTRQHQDRLLFATSRDWWMGNRNYYGRTPCVYHLCTWCHHTWPDLPGLLHICILQVIKDWRWEWPRNKAIVVPASKHSAYWIEWPPFGARVKVHTLNTLSPFSFSQKPIKGHTERRKFVITTPILCNSMKIGCVLQGRKHPNQPVTPPPQLTKW